MRPGEGFGFSCLFFFSSLPPDRKLLEQALWCVMYAGGVCVEPEMMALCRWPLVGFGPVLREKEGE